MYVQVQIVSRTTTTRLLKLKSADIVCPALQQPPMCVAEPMGPAESVRKDSHHPAFSAFPPAAASSAPEIKEARFGQSATFRPAC